MGRMRWAMVMIAVLGIAAAVSAFALNPVGSSPKEIGKGTKLSLQHPVLTFAGAIPEPVPVPAFRNPVPTVCLNDCQQWSVTTASTAPFMVSVRSDAKSTDDGFEIYVYDPSGHQVSVANGIGSDGQSTVVRPRSTGTYTIAITVLYSFDTAAAYHGEVRLMAGPSWPAFSCKTAKPCAILPEMRVEPPSDVHVSGLPPVASTPLGFPLPVDVPTPTSCYADEIVRTGATRCLRFTSEVDDIGAGTLTLQLPWLSVDNAIPTSAFVPGECEARQIINYTDGSIRYHDAGGCTFHAAHAHFHYKTYVEYSLHKVLPDGRTGPEVAKSLKESFCLADDGYFGFGHATQNGPRNYAGQPGCNVPSLPHPDMWVTMGNSPGYGDIYTWDTPDQFIDISAVPQGIYDIVSIGNPASHLVLAGNQHPCGATRIALAADAVHVIKQGVPCTG